MDGPFGLCSNQLRIAMIKMRRNEIRAGSFCVTALLLGNLITLAGCGGTSKSSNPPAAMTLSLAASSVDVQQDGNLVASVALTIGNAPGAVTIGVTGLPQGISAKVNADSASPTVSFSGGVGVAAGTYQVTITAVSGGQTASQPLTLINDVVAVVQPIVDTNVGIKGQLSQFMATSFQIFQYTGDIFGSGTTAVAREQMLNNLHAIHNRLQVIMDAMPMKSNTGTASDWDFTMLDTTVKPVQDASPDHSPEFQIATAPYWMCDSSGHLLKSHFQDFADYAANLVRYYNRGGFDWGGKHFQSPSPFSITWWGIFNEYNLNNLTASDYLSLYNTTVAAMLAVDPSIKFSAVELSDYGLGTGGRGDPMQSLPTFLGTSPSDGVNTPVDVLSTHFYGSCNQTDPDIALFNNAPVFAENVRYFYKALQARTDLASTQVWVTENNVNADFNDGTGHSNCNPGQVFVTDQRGTSAFFAAWRPYVFSQLGKAGNRALYHWDYSSDKQYGEVDATSNPYLSYWVDRTLATSFPPGQEILTVDATETSDIETLATLASDGKVRVMVVNHAVHAANDNNGAGDPRTIVISTNGLGNFSAASLITVDANTSVANGPAGVAVPATGRTPITLKGYGFAILTLTP